MNRKSILCSLFILFLILFIFPANAETLCSRSEFSNIFCEAGGRRAEISGYQKNYFDTSWQEIDTDIITTDCYSGYSNCAKGIFSANFKDSLNIFESIMLERNGYFITFQPSRVNYRNDQETVQQIEITQPVSGVVNGNTINYAGIFGTGLDMKLVYLPQILKENIEVAVSFLPSPNSDITSGTNPTVDIDFVMKFDSSLDFIVDGSPWDKSSTVNGEEIVLKASGETQLVLPRPYVYDNGSFVYGRYQLTKSGPRYYIIVKVPLNWVLGKETVTIDKSMGLENNRYDGFVYSSGRNYDFIFANLSYGTGNRVFFDFDTTSITDSADVKNITLVIYSNNSGSGVVYFKKLNQTASSVTNDSLLYDEIAYADTFAYDVLEDGENNISLESAADYLKSKLNENWFSLGIKTSGNGSGEALIYTSESPDIEKRPKLIIEYEINYTPASINIQNPENKTYYDIPTLNYTASNAERCWYSLDAGSNISLGNCTNATFNISEGYYTLYFYANNSIGNITEVNVSFTVSFYPNTNLISPANDYSTIPENITFIFNVTDKKYAALNCSLLIGGSAVASESTANSTNTNFTYSMPAGTGQKWGINCTNDDNRSDYKTRTIHIAIPSDRRRDRNSPVCNESWECTDWSECSNSAQARNCTDKNKCGKTEKRPDLNRSCEAKKENPKEIKGALFDIRAELTAEAVTNESGLMATIILINFGEPGAVNATIQYTIKDSSGAIIYEETETINVETQTEFLKRFDTSNFKEGEYKLYLNLNYEGQKEPAQAEKAFTVRRNAESSGGNNLYMALIPIICIAVYAVYRALKKIFK